MARVFKDDEIAELARMGAIWCTPTPTQAQRAGLTSEDIAVIRGRVKQIGDDLQLDEKTIIAMLCAVQRATTLRAQTNAVQQFVENNGLQAFGAVHRLLPDVGGALRIASTSSTYTDALKAANKIALKYLVPIAATDTPDSLRGRYKDVEETLQLLHDGWTCLNEDDLQADNQRDSLRLRFVQAEKDMHALLVMTKAVAAKLAQHTHSRLLHKSFDQRLQYFLEHPKTLLDTAQNLVKTYRAKRMPLQRNPFMTRYTQVQQAAAALRSRIAWLETTHIFAEAERLGRIAIYRCALMALVGDCLATAPPTALGGLLDLSVLNKTQLYTLRHCLSALNAAGRAAIVYVDRQLAHRALHPALGIAC